MLSNALVCDSQILEVMEGTPQEIVDRTVKFLKSQFPGQEIVVVYVEDK